MLRKFLAIFCLLHSGSCASLTYQPFDATIPLHADSQSPSFVSAFIYARYIYDHLSISPASLKIAEENLSKFQFLPKNDKLLLYRGVVTNDSSSLGLVLTVATPYLSRSGQLKWSAKYKIKVAQNGDILEEFLLFDHREDLNRRIRVINNMSSGNSADKLLQALRSQEPCNVRLTFSNKSLIGFQVPAVPLRKDEYQLFFPSHTYTRPSSALDHIQSICLKSGDINALRGVNYRGEDIRISDIFHSIVTYMVKNNSIRADSG